MSSFLGYFHSPGRLISEPLESASEKILTLRVALLLALALLKRVRGLQALSVALSYLDFTPGLVKFRLHPRPGYAPKVPFSTIHPVVLQAFLLRCLTYLSKKGFLSCPVTALRIYVNCSGLWRTSDQLLVCFGGHSRGSSISKQRLSNWIVGAISFGYEACGKALPLGIRAHSIRSVAIKVLAKGASLQDICAVKG